MHKLMKSTLALWSVVFLSLVGILAAANERVTSPKVEQVRLGVHANGQTRIVLDMNEAPDYRIVPQAEGGNRLVVAIERGDFGGVASPRATGLVKRAEIRDGRLAIELASTALPVSSFVLPPAKGVAHHRLVIDVSPVSQAEFAEAVAAAPALIAVAAVSEAPEKTPARATAADDSPLPPELRALAAGMTPQPNLKPRRARRADPEPAAAPVIAARRDAPVIVIDPGHGGHDPGAVGPTGVREEDMTLSAAQVLADILRSRGYAVTLTRNDDVYLKHEDRIEIARRQQADLFMSLHADALSDRSVRGASVYTLSEDRSSRMADEVTSTGDFRIFDREFHEEDTDVSSILFDLANNDTKNHSVRLANALINRMRGRVTMVNNTHRQAGLKVLLSPDVPAVLVELAFISNEIDEANLQSVQWRRRAMSAIADGIDDYFADNATAEDDRDRTAAIAAGAGSAR
jgi:N-acetylmuramoyl-L-alanine amidase